MKGLRPTEVSNMHRWVTGPLAAVMVLSLAPSFAPQAQAQTLISREVTAMDEGFCFTDTDADDSFTIADIPLEDPAVTAATLPVITNNNATINTLEVTITQPELSGGNTIGPGGAVASTNVGPGTWNIDISRVCIGGVSRTDTLTYHVDDDSDAATPDTDDDGVAGTDTSSTTSTLAVTSDDDAIYDDDGFTFDGNIDLTFSGQVDGDVEFTGATAATNVTLDFSAAGLEITGDLDLGSGGADATAVSIADITVDATIGGDVDLTDTDNIEADIDGDIGGDVSFTNGDNFDLTFAGTIGGDINIDDTSDVTLTSTATATSFLANNIDNSVLTIGGALTSVDLDNATDITATVSATSAAFSATNVEDGNFTLSGGGGSFDFDGSDNITITSSATASLFSAENITNGLRMTNTGSIGTLDVDGTDYLTLDLQSGSVVNNLVMSDITNPSSYVTNAGGIGRITIDNTSAADTVDLVNTNSGSISTSLDEALIVETGGGGAVNLEIVNSGNIGAASSDAINLTGMQAGIFDLQNSGSLTTSAGTNNTINASGVQASIFISNGGSASIENNNNLAMNFRNMVGNFSLVTAGTIGSNQTAIDLRGASATTASAFEICNGYARDSDGNCSEVSAGTREIKATGSNAIIFDAMTANIDIFNGAGAKIIAEDSRAIAASGVTGSINIQNKGNIRAYRAAGVSNEQAVLLENVSGDITFANIGSAALVDSRDRTINLETAGGAIHFSNAGDVKSTQPISNADATAADNYALRLFRSGSSADFDSFDNSGDISSTSDHAVLAVDLVCDDDLAEDAACFANSGTLTAARQFAVAVDNVADFSLSNSGTITARDRTFEATDLSGDIVITSSSAVRATHFFDPLYTDPDADSYVMRLVKESGVEGDVTLSNSGIISNVPVDSYNVSTDEADSAATPGAAIIISGFSDTNDSVRIDNTGTIETPEGSTIDVSGQRSVTITNNAASAIISAVDNFAVNASGVLGSFTLENTGGTIRAANFAVNAPSVTGAVSISSSGTIAASGIAISATNAGGLVTLNNDTGGAISSDSNLAFDAGNGAAGLTLISNGTIAASGVTAVQAAGVTGAMSFTIGGNISNSNDTAINAPNASSTLSYTQTAGTVIADAEVLNFNNAASAVSLSLSGGTVQSRGTQAIDLEDASSSISLTNAGMITALGTTVNMRGADGAISVTNQSGGTINATGTGVTALDMANAAAVTLVNAGTIAAADKTIIATGLSGALAITNSSGGVISSVADEAIDATGIDDAVLTNNGTISGGDSGTLLRLTGADVTVTNSGIIDGGDTALDLGAGATLVNSGRITAGSSSGTALRVDGTGAQITLNDGSVLLGDIVAATPITDPDDRHQINLNIDVSKSFAFEFDDANFALTSTNTTARPVVEGSAHAVSPYLNYTLDTMHAMRAASIRQNFNREAIGSNSRTGDTKLWGMSGSRDASTDHPFELDVTEYGGLANARMLQLFGAEVGLLLAYDTIEMEIAGTEQSLESSYVGIGLGVKELRPFENFSLGGFVMAGQSSQETGRNVYGNKLANGVQAVQGEFDSLIVDAAIEAKIDYRFGRSWYVAARAGAGGALISSEGFDEGSFYRHDDHEALLVTTEVGFNVAYDLQQGYLNETDFIYLDATLGVDAYGEGDEYDIEFLAGSIADADGSLTYTDAHMGGQQNRLTIGYHRMFDGQTAIDFNVSRRFMDDGLELDEAQLSVFVRF